MICLFMLQLNDRLNGCMSILLAFLFIYLFCSTFLLAGACVACVCGFKQAVVFVIFCNVLRATGV